MHPNFKFEEDQPLVAFVLNTAEHVVYGRFSSREGDGVWVKLPDGTLHMYEVSSIVVVMEETYQFATEEYSETTNDHRDYNTGSGDVTQQHGPHKADSGAELQADEEEVGEGKDPQGRRNAGDPYLVSRASERSRRANLLARQQHRFCGGAQ